MRGDGYAREGCKDRGISNWGRILTGVSAWIPSFLKVNISPARGVGARNEHS